MLKIYTKADTLSGGVTSDNIVYLEAKDDLGLPVRIYYFGIFRKKSAAFQFLAELSHATDLPDWRKEGYGEIMKSWTSDISDVYSRNEDRVVYFTQYTQKEDGQYILCATKVGARGFWRLNELLGSNKAEADLICEERNAESGISKEEALVTLVSTMAKQ